MWNKLLGIEQRLKTIKVVLTLFIILCVALLTIGILKGSNVAQNASTTTMQTGHILDNVNTNVNTEDFILDAKKKIEKKNHDKEEQKLSYDLLTEGQKADFDKLPMPFRVKYLNCTKDAWPPVVDIQSIKDGVISEDAEIEEGAIIEAGAYIFPKAIIKSNAKGMLRNVNGCQSIDVNKVLHLLQVLNQVVLK